MRKIFLASTIVAFALLLSGCNFPTQVSQPQTLISQQQTNSYDLQSKCATDAKAYFASNWQYSDPQATVLDYTNHYNKSLNRCFIKVIDTSVLSSGAIAKMVYLYDVQEKTMYGNFYEYIASYPNSYDNISVCEVVKQKCASLEEFNNLINTYMGN